MTDMNRRGFLASSAGLLIGLSLPVGTRAQSGAAAALSDGATDDASFAPNAFIRVAPDDTVTVMIKHIEFGQGPHTGLSTLVAEEMDADWSQMRAESAPANNELYKNLFFGMQGTGGSTAMANSYMQMRKAGVGITIVHDAGVPFYHDWVAPEGYFTGRGRDVPPGCEEIDDAERGRRLDESTALVRERFEAPRLRIRRSSPPTSSC